MGFRLISAALLALSAAMGQDAAVPPAPAAPRDVLHPRFKISTSMGEFTVDLDAEKAPLTVRNFAEYAGSGFYDGTIVHRVMPKFLIQGGGYTPELSRKEGLRPGIANEWQNGLKNLRGTVAMARLTGKPHSATSQFFINVVDNPTLDAAQVDGAGYAVFGTVASGLDVVDAIKAVEVDVNADYDGGQSKVVPVTPVIIESVTLLAPQIPAEELAAQLQAHVAAVRQQRIAAIVAQAEQASGRQLEKSDSGLMWVVLREGDGASPKPTDRVDVHYTGWFLDGTKIDSSLDKGAAQEVSLSRGLTGWTEALTAMKVGEKRMLIVPPDLAYGAQGRDPIPPDATLHFEVELLAIKAQ